MTVDERIEQALRAARMSADVGETMATVQALAAVAEAVMVLADKVDDLRRYSLPVQVERMP